MLEIIVAVALFTLVVIMLGVIILLSRSVLVPSGDVHITVNGERDIAVPVGGKLLNVLTGQSLFLPSACGGGGTCGQCKVRILEGGGELLPTEKVHINKRAAREGERLACQVNVDGDLAIEVPQEVFGVNRWECGSKSH